MFSTLVVLLVVCSFEQAHGFRHVAGRLITMKPPIPSVNAHQKGPGLGTSISPTSYSFLPACYRGYVSMHGTSMHHFEGAMAIPATTATQVSATALDSSNGNDRRSNSLKIGFLFGLWYALNIGYNISNKKLLNLVPNLTYTVAFLQVLIGMIYLLPVWFLGIRSPPNVTMKDLSSLLPVGILHTLTHLGAVVSLSAGAVSFTHIVKAAEPAVSALFAAVFQKSFMALPVYLSLIPVMGGVAIASATELSFTWLSFIAAMISNVASATRGIFGKSALGNIPQEKKLNAANLYGVMNIMAILMCFPVCLLLEGSQIFPTVQKLFAAGKGNEFIKQTLMSGMFYYLYNEVAFLALDNVAPVTHAIGNTIKRVVIILTSVLVFGTKMTGQGVLGSAVAIGGVLLYSLAKSKYQNK